MNDQQKKKANKLSKGITGIAGEYYVAAELSRHGFYGFDNITK